MSEPIWLTLMRIELATPRVDAAPEPLGVGDEDVVADELHVAAEAAGERGPAVPVVLGHAVLDRDDRVAVAQIGEVVGELGARERALLARERVRAVVEELRRGDVERRARSRRPACSRRASIAASSSFSASSFDGRSGAKPPSSPSPVDEPTVVQQPAQRVVRLGAPAQRLGEAHRADRQRA